MAIEPFFGSQAPVFTIDGEAKGELGRDLAYLEVEEATHGLRTLTARFGNWGSMSGSEEPGFRYFDGKILDLGKAIEVSLGPASEARIVFKGAISALESRLDEGGEPQLGLYAEDKLMNLRMTRRLRTYQNQSDAQIARAIAGEHGLSAEVDAPGPTYDVVQQWNQSDLAFLRDRARLIQAELWLDGEKLCFKTRGRRSATDLTLVQGSDLLSARVRADLAHQRTAITVSGYNAGTLDLINEKAEGSVVQGEIAGGRTGPDILQRAFGDRASHRTREVPLTSEEARAWAEAEMLRRARGFVHLAGVARGQPDMIVGTHVTLARVGAPFEGAGYYVTRVCHVYDLSSGFRTLFDAERPTLSEAAA